MIYTVTLNPALDRELTVPGIIFDSVLRASGVRIDFGGKGFNVSRALAALDTGSTAMGFIGGPAGQRIAAGLTGAGIKTDFVEIEGETRTNVSVVSETEIHHLKVNEPGPTVSAAEASALLDKIRGTVKADDLWVMSGALPPGVPSEIYAEIVTIVQKAGGLAIVDTSGDALSPACQAAPFLVKPNIDEARELSSLPIESVSDADKAAEQIQKLGAQNVMITLGSQGACLRFESQTWQAVPPSIEEKSPIGAGDASVAGLVYGLSRELNWPETLRWSMACGAAAASLPGTAVGSLETVTAITGQIEIHE